jgi:hypothetical protein
MRGRILFASSLLLASAGFAMAEDHPSASPQLIKVGKDVVQSSSAPQDIKAEVTDIKKKVDEKTGVLDSTKEKLGEMGHATKEKLTDVGSAVKDKAVQVTADTKEKIGDLSHAAGTMAKDVKDATKDKVNQLTQTPASTTANTVQSTEVKTPATGSSQTPETKLNMIQKDSTQQTATPSGQEASKEASKTASQGTAQKPAEEKPAEKQGFFSRFFQ